MKATMFKTDAQLRQDVIDEIERDWRFKPAEIGVEVDQGIVSLTGTVSSYTKLMAAANIAAEIAGTKGVANELTVRLPGTALPNDGDVAAQVRAALKWDVDVPEEKIEVIVRNGAVTLKGKVDYWYQKKAAGDTVARLSGVAAVNNHITVVPPVQSDRDVRDEIVKAIGRRIPLAADRIKVEVKDGIVTLSGNVQFYADRLQAEKAAWMTEGVRNVINQLAATW
jgi:osmotically-inducible protein OsmY